MVYKRVYSGLLKIFAKDASLVTHTMWLEG